MRRTFELGETKEALGSLLDAVEGTVLAETAEKELALEARLLAEETLTNIRKYAKASRTELELAVTEALVSLEIRDDGQAFDPLGEPPPNLDAPIEDRDEGGLGVHLVKSVTDEASYRREGTWNVLRLTKRR